jgi:DNA-binding NarL/FixJ family response regulator
MTTFHTLLVCDDRPEIREAITAVLHDVPALTVIGEAADASSCLAAVRDLSPDLLILDYSIPQGGPEVVRSAIDANPGMLIIVFSGRGDARVKREMLEAGAYRYVLKTGRIMPLLHAVRAALVDLGTESTDHFIPGQLPGPDRTTGSARWAEPTFRGGADRVRFRGPGR